MPASLVPIAFVLVAMLFDLKTRQIPDSIPVGLLGWSLFAAALGANGLSWGSLLGGLLIGFALSVVLFALGGLGGGDVKLLTALGAALGHAAILPTLFWIAIAGGVLSVIAALRQRQDLAYVPAIAAGLLIRLFLDGKG